MRKIIVVGVLLVAAWGFSVAASNPQPAVKGGAIVVEEAVAAGDVVKTNKLLKTVTLRDATGKKVTVGIPPAIKNIDEITPGSQLQLRYLEGVVLTLGRPGIHPAADGETVRLVPKSGSPAQVIATSKTVTTMVQDIDRKNREITVKDPDENPLTLKVPENTSGFDELKIGDTVIIQYTDAVALSVNRGR